MNPVLATLERRAYPEKQKAVADCLTALLEVHQCGEWQGVLLDCKPGGFTWELRYRDSLIVVPDCNGGYSCAITQADLAPLFNTALDVLMYPSPMEAASARIAGLHAQLHDLRNNISGLALQFKADELAYAKQHAKEPTKEVQHGRRSASSGRTRRNPAGEPETAGAGSQG